MSVLVRKALMDITRRKGRSLLSILGILLGILGLTAMNEATDLIGGAFFYSTDVDGHPEYHLHCQQSASPRRDGSWASPQCRARPAAHDLPDHLASSGQCQSGRAANHSLFRNATPPVGGVPIDHRTHAGTRGDRHG